MTSKARRLRAKKERRAKAKAKKSRKKENARKRLESVWAKCSLCKGAGRVEVKLSEDRSALAPCPNACRQYPESLQ